MKTPKIANAVGHIDDDLVVAATERKKAKSSLWLKWSAVAACLALIVSIGFAIPHWLPNDDQGMPGIYIEDRESIFATIEEWRDEGFVCTIIDSDIHDFIAEGYSVLIQFNETTKVTTLDGSKFQYDEENPNAPSCGLPVGTTVEIYFGGVNYKDDGMASSLDAKEIIPQK